MENINLFLEMQKIVDKYMKAYKTDFEYDKKILLDKNYNTDSFYWIVRSSGTHMINPMRMEYENDMDYTEVRYWTPQSLKIYQVDISLRGRKYVYGTLKEINKNYLLEKIKEAKDFTGANVLVISKDERKIIYKGIVKGETSKEIYYNTLKINHLKEHPPLLDIYILNYIDDKTI